MASFIILGALWSYPILTYFILRLTKERQNYRNSIFWVAVSAACLTSISILTSISTTLKELDWLFLTSIYFLVCLMLWRTQFQANKILKWTGKIATIAVFAIGYLFSTIGALGTVLAIGQFETDREKWLDDGLIVKEQTLGNAISDYRGKRIEVYKTLKWFPIVEWQLQEKSYYNLATYLQPLTINYKPSENRIYLSTSVTWGPDKKRINWADTLLLKDR